MVMLSVIYTGRPSRKGKRFKELNTVVKDIKSGVLIPGLLLAVERPKEVLQFKNLLLNIFHVEMIFFFGLKEASVPASLAERLREVRSWFT